MKKNMGSTDRIIRLTLAALFIVLFFTNTISGTFGIVLMVAAAVFAGTSFINFCPLYSIIGVNTCKTKS